MRREGARKRRGKRLSHVNLSVIQVLTVFQGPRKRNFAQIYVFCVPRRKQAGGLALVQPILRFDLVFKKQRLLCSGDVFVVVFYIHYNQ